mmetsp:Transcript_64456/g.122194  ORF Transcript_64456/g.122194 Transcript_64456/m.122194 type:complete len:287 (+) Transcript_64456:853-1713(+)
MDYCSGRRTRLNLPRKGWDHPVDLRSSGLPTGQHHVQSCRHPVAQHNLQSSSCRPLPCSQLRASPQAAGHPRGSCSPFRCWQLPASLQAVGQCQTSPRRQHAGHRQHGKQRKHRCGGGQCQHHWESSIRCQHGHGQHHRESSGRGQCQHSRESRGERGSSSFRWVSTSKPCKGICWKGEHKPRLLSETCGKHQVPLLAPRTGELLAHRTGEHKPWLLSEAFGLRVPVLAPCKGDKQRLSSKFQVLGPRIGKQDSQSPGMACSLRFLWTPLTKLLTSWQEIVRVLQT